MPAMQEPGKFDVRMYIGIIFFRWQMIVVCLLYSMLGATVYILAAPKDYSVRCKIMAYRDPNLEIGTGGSPWRSFSAHVYLLQSEKLRGEAAKQLQEAWGKQIGSKDAMMLPVSVRPDTRVGHTLDISVICRNAGYGSAFLGTLMRLHEAEWNSLQRAAADQATNLLFDELKRLEDKIRVAENDLIDYQRLHDIPRVDARGSMESAHLQALMQRRNGLQTEMLLLEAQNPVLKGEGAGVIRAVANLTRETGEVKPPTEVSSARTGGVVDPNAPDVIVEPAETKKNTLADDLASEEVRGWHDLRIRLTRLQQQEKDLSVNLKPEHPEMRRIKKEIDNIRNQLDVAAEIQLSALKDRYRALQIQMNAVEGAEQRWQAKNLMASQRRAELKRMSGVVSRYESNYNMLYQRLNDMRVAEELKAEHFKTIEEVGADPTPVWPDPSKILLMALAIGLGSGFGLAFVAQAFDNKVQTIADVEHVLGVPFLGGIPCWVHSDLESTIRPIVTEEHSTGAIEAYRALRTSVLAECAKSGQKVIMFTSADSKEGKTLTVLNLAIMISQMGKRVLLCDMDLRRGRLHRSLGHEKEPGINDVLKKGESLKNVIKETRFANLFLAPAGGTIENTAELLQAVDLKELIAEVYDDYEFILIDTAPVLRVTDTVIMASQGVGSVIYVLRINRTPKPMVKYSLDMLKDVNIMGVILNNIEMHRISSLYYSYQYPNYAYYSNAYAYGYDYYYYGEHKPGIRGGWRRGRQSWDHRRREFVRWLRRTFLPLE